MTQLVNELLVAQGGLRIPGGSPAAGAAAQSADGAGNITWVPASHGLLAYSAAAKRLSGLQHLWLLNEASGTSAADQVAGGSALTYGADVSGFVTTGPDGSSSAPANNGSTNRVAIASGVTVPGTVSHSYFWWQRYDVAGTDDGMLFEIADSPTFSKFVQHDYNYSGVVGGSSGNAFLAENLGQAGGPGNYMTKDSGTKEGGLTGAGKLGWWYFYCALFDLAAATGSAGGAPISVYRNGALYGTTNPSTASFGAGTAMTGLNMGVLGRNNNGTRQLPIHAAIQGLGVTTGLLTIAQMHALMVAMGS